VSLNMFMSSIQQIRPIMIVHCYIIMRRAMMASCVAAAHLPGARDWSFSPSCCCSARLASFSSNHRASPPPEATERPQTIQMSYRRQMSHEQ
jgi:hypothetical protein